MNEYIKKIRNKLELQNCELTRLSDDELNYAIYKLNSLASVDIEAKNGAFEDTKQSDDDYESINLKYIYGNVVAEIMLNTLIICAKMNFYPDYYIDKIMPMYFERKKKYYDAECLDAELSLCHKIKRECDDAYKNLDFLKTIVKLTLTETEARGFIRELETELKNEPMMSTLSSEILANYNVILRKFTLPESNNESLRDFITVGSKDEAKNRYKKALLTWLKKAQELFEERKKHIKDIEKYNELEREHSALGLEIEKAFKEINMDASQQIDINTQYEQTVKKLTELDERCGVGVSEQLFSKFANKCWELTSKLFNQCDDESEEMEYICKLLCECLRYFAFVGINPKDEIEPLMADDDYLITNGQHHMETR